MVKNNDKGNSIRTYEILVYGIEKKGLKTPPAEIQTRNYKLVFEPFNTQRRFDEFDGVVLYQGIFESFNRQEDVYRLATKLVCNCYEDELDKRIKELDLLLESKGFVCFILCEPFIDYASGSGKCKTTDLAKIRLNWGSFYRNGIGGRVTYIESKRSEFERFIKRFGAAYTYFQNPNDDMNLRVIADTYSGIVGMIISDNQFFIPSLIPDNNPKIIEEYFKLLADALTATCNKLIYEVPAWVNVFEFAEETKLKDEQQSVEKQLEQIIAQLEILQRFKRILLLDGELLVEAVVDVLRNGFNLTVDDTDKYREDVKILDEENNPIIFVEIKGTNRGVERKYINQCDTHRQEAGLPPEFPSILIINTHIKNARTVAEKDQPIPNEQIRHAARNNVLILRTLDLLFLLAQIRDDNIGTTTKDVISELTTKSGWLKASRKAWEIVKA